MGSLTQPCLDLLPLGVPQGGPRYLVAHLPAFALERCGWSAADVVVLVAERRNATRVVALTPAARALGLREDMVVAEARAWVEDVVVEPYDEVGEAIDRADLVLAFEPFGDRVAAYGDDAVVIEVRHVAAWFGGEHALVDKVKARLEELGHMGQVAITDHPRASWALARHHEGGIVVPEGEGAAALASLPLDALDPSDDLRDAWRSLGLRTVGAWAVLDPASVAGRFGEEGVLLHEVARGAPGPPWSDLPVVPPVPHLRVEVPDELAQIDQIDTVLRPGIQRLRDALAEIDQVAARLSLRLELAWGGSVRVRVRVAQPTRDVSVLARLLHDRLERTALTAPVTGMVLHADEAVPDGNGQQDLLARREGAGAWSALVSRLCDVLGDDAVAQAHVVESWRPEQTWAPSRVGDECPVVLPEVTDDPVERQEGAAWQEPRPRPTLLRAPPMPLRVRDEGGVPKAIHTRRGWRPIQRCRGPERLEGQWWQAQGGYARAYWVVALASGTAWLFQARGQWFLHGYFD